MKKLILALSISLICATPSLADIDIDAYNITNNEIEVDLLEVSSTGEIPLDGVHEEGPIGHVKAGLAKLNLTLNEKGFVFRNIHFYGIKNSKYFAGILITPRNTEIGYIIDLNTALQLVGINPNSLK